jgi:hypothetical protein
VTETEPEWWCGGQVWGLAVGPGDDCLVSCSDDATLIVWKR